MAHQGTFRIDAARMDTFWQYRSAGQSIPEAARHAGMSVATGQQIVAHAGGIRPRTPPPRSGRFLSFTERETIALCWAAGHSKAEIARQLGRHRCTIGRELARNATRAHHQGIVVRGGIGYRASTAHRSAQSRARRPKPAKLATNIVLRTWVQDKLTRRWSPRQIAATLAHTYPDRPEMRVSHETIYHSLYVQSRGALRRELTACLRTGRAVRRPQRRADQRQARPGRFPHMLMISERPAEITDRAVPGHWEGDLIMGAGNASAIGTLVERSTRFCLLLHLPHGHAPDHVARVMIAQMRRLPEHLRRTVTWDQGLEMARHLDIRMALDLPVYFCDPHSPWQRGSNENTNGLLRQYFPEGTDLSVHTAQDLDVVATELNERPRMTLGWQTPMQRMTELLLR